MNTRNQYFNLFIRFVAVALLVTTGAANAMPILTLTGGNVGTTPSGDSSHGWTFLANTDLYVTDLGLYDSGLDGFEIDHDIGLFRLSDGVLLTSGMLSTGAGDMLVDNFRYVDTADVSLVAGETYVIAYYSATGSSDDIVTSGGTLNVDPSISILNYNWAGSTGGLVLPGNTTTATRYGPNFLTGTAPNGVPEPTTLVLFGLGLLGLGAARKMR